MPNEISHIKLPSGITYDIKDAQARADIAVIQSSVTGVLNWVGPTTTAISEGATTNPIMVAGQSYTAHSGDVVQYGGIEFVFSSSDNAWHEFGSTGSLGALAYKSQATGTVTPTGTISVQTFSGTQATVSVTGTTAGTVAISKGNGTANYTPEGSVSKPTFSGTEGNISVSGVPNGSVTISKGNGTANYTPEGTVTPTVTLNTATVNSITDVGTLPNFSATVADETLTMSFTQGTLPTKGQNQTVATGVQSATATFVGTGAELKGTFTGSATTSTGTFTPAGQVSQPTFSGTGAELKATFTGGAITSTGSYTPAGSISQAVFTGDETTVTVS